MSANVDLPQKICPIKTLYYFILKCQETDRKLRLRLSNSPAKSDDTTNLADEFIDNEATEFDCVMNEESK